MTVGEQHRPWSSFRPPRKNQRPNSSIQQVQNAEPFRRTQRMNWVRLSGDDGQGHDGATTGPRRVHDGATTGPRRVHDGSTTGPPSHSAPSHSAPSHSAPSHSAPSHAALSHPALSHPAPSRRAPSHPPITPPTFACVKGGCSRNCLVYRHGRNDDRGPVAAIAVAAITVAAGGIWFTQSSCGVIAVQRVLD